MFMKACQNIVPLLVDTFLNQLLEKMRIACRGPGTANGLVSAFRGGLAIAVYCGDGHVHGPYACSKGKKSGSSNCDFDSSRCLWWRMVGFSRGLPARLASP